MDTTLITSKSASGLTLIVSLSVLFSGFGSYVSLSTTAILVMLALVTFTKVLIIKVMLDWFVKFPIVQIPVLWLYVPLPLSEIQTNPFGKVSFTYISTASSGPLFLTVIVHVISSLNLGVLFDTVLIIPKSASWPTSIVELSSLFVKSGSGVSEVTFTVLVITSSDTSTVVTIYNTLLPPFSMSPIVHILVSLSYVPLPLALTNVKPFGKISIANAFIAASGPLFTTVIIHVMLSPFLGPWLSTVLSIAKSAIGSTSVVLLASLFVVSLSGVVEFTTATLVIVALVTFTLVVIVNVTVLSIPKSPICQIPWA